MTRYIVSCDQCGKIGQSTIKKRSDIKMKTHAKETGHTVRVTRVRESVWKGEA